MVRARRINPFSDCPVTATLAAVGGKWKLFIVYSLTQRPYHFAAIRRVLPNVSQKVLAEQLGELIADGIVQREQTGPVPAPVIYSLTQYGLTLMPLVDFVRVWGRGHIERFNASYESHDDPCGFVRGRVSAQACRKVARGRSPS
jgi:DNA-binding HxlR family transcriptional regulator